MCGALLPYRRRISTGCPTVGALSRDPGLKSSFNAVVPLAVPCGVDQFRKRSSCADIIYFTWCNDRLCIGFLLQSSIPNIQRTLYCCSKLRTSTCAFAHTHRAFISSILVWNHAREFEKRICRGFSWNNAALHCTQRDSIDVMNHWTLVGHEHMIHVDFLTKLDAKPVQASMSELTSTTTTHGGSLNVVNTVRMATRNSTVPQWSFSSPF
jgi:hypothetical protein